jgi:hypothetical protein
MDPVIQNAIRRRSDLRSELRDVERFLELYQQFKAPSDPRQATLDVREPVEDSEEQTESTATAFPPFNGPGVTPEPAEAVPGLSREELRPHIRETIIEAGKPLTRGQILRRLDAKDVRVGGKADRSKNMGTILWRLRDDFVNLTGYGYWPRDLAYVEAGYDPEDLNSPEAIDYVLRQSPPEHDL